MFLTVIEVIPHKQQRYNTVGDWFTDADGNQRIRVSKLSDWRREFLIGIHEQIEAALCASGGITQEMVDAFDMSPDNAELDEPGESQKAPYHKEHKFADAVERLLAIELGVDWNDYSDEVAKLGTI